MCDPCQMKVTQEMALVTGCPGLAMTSNSMVGQPEASGLSSRGLLRAQNPQGVKLTLPVVFSVIA